MFEWIVFSVCALGTLECLSRIWYNCFLDMIEVNKLITARITEYTATISKASDDLESGKFDSNYLTARILFPTLMQNRYMRFLERQNDMHWRQQAFWIFRMFFMGTRGKANYLRRLIRKYGKRTHKK